MADYIQNNKRIVKNTMMLYVRMLLLMFVNLYTSRVVLNSLGVEDYGIYNVVGGFVAMFAILSGSLSASISRFITFEIGRNNHEYTNRVFSTSVIIMLFICLILVILSFTLGYWFLNTHLNIPMNRLGVANWVYLISIITFVINLLSVPYNACIIAHEKMKAFAYIGILDAFGKLGISFIILASPIDRLVYYAILMCALSILIRFIYVWYCKKNFKECVFKWKFEKKLTKEIFAFAGWNFIGSSAGILKEQGVNVLLNIYCGPLVNAARGIAIQVSTAITQFSQNFITAISPQITKSYAAHDVTYARTLVYYSARYSYLLLFVISLPIIIKTESIVSLWLGIVPDHLVSFIRLTLISVIIDSLSNGIITLMLATGKIRNYQIVVGCCVLMNFPLSYIFLKAGYSPELVFVVSIFISVCCLLLRIWMLNAMVSFPLGKFAVHVLLPVIAVSVVSIMIISTIAALVPNILSELISCTVLTILVTVITIYYIGLTKNERQLIVSKIAMLIKHKK